MQLLYFAVTGHAPKPLDYEPRPQPSTWPLWLQILALVVWAFILIFIWVGALTCPVVLAIGIVNLFHPLPSTHMTFGRNVEWIAQNAVLSAVFITLAAWHLRWRRSTEASRSDANHQEHDSVPDRRAAASNLIREMKSDYHLGGKPYDDRAELHER